MHGIGTWGHSICNSLPYVWISYNWSIFSKYANISIAIILNKNESLKLIKTILGAKRTCTNNTNNVIIIHVNPWISTDSSWIISFCFSFFHDAPVTWWDGIVSLSSPLVLHRSCWCTCIILPVYLETQLLLGPVVEFLDLILQNWCQVVRLDYYAEFLH